MRFLERMGLQKAADPKEARRGAEDARIRGDGPRRRSAAAVRAAAAGATRRARGDAPRRRRSRDAERSRSVRGGIEASSALASVARRGGAVDRSPWSGRSLAADAISVRQSVRRRVRPPQEMKKWKRELAKEQRSMDREIRKMEAAEAKSKAECQKLGKQGRIDACKARPPRGCGPAPSDDPRGTRGAAATRSPRTIRAGSARAVDVRSQVRRDRAVRQPGLDRLQDEEARLE